MKVSITEKNLEQEQLIQIVKNRLNWSESILRSFTFKELCSVYDRILQRQSIHKAKVSEKGRFGLSMYVPKQLRNEHELKYGDRFNIKYNQDKKEVYLDLAEIGGTFKLRSNGNIDLPYKLVEKNLLKQGDDVMITCRDGRITMKSFSFMQ